MKNHEQDPEIEQSKNEASAQDETRKQPYEAPRVESVKLSDEAAESLT